MIRELLNSEKWRSDLMFEIYSIIAAAGAAEEVTLESHGLLLTGILVCLSNYENLLE